MLSDHEDQARFGPYRVVRPIGRGGMGTIFEAEDTCLGHHVALKLPHQDAARRPGASERFLREGRAVARVQHPHVIQVLSSGTERGMPYLAMELLHGCDLSELVSRRRPRLPVDQALDLLLPVFAGIGAAHDAGVIHCDLKPSNVFIARGPGGGPWPKVLDFGVSKVIDGADAGSPADAVIGTAAYLAPEQARAAGSASFASDQYSLAVLLYQFITGEMPFEGRSILEIVESVMTAPPVPPGQRASGIPSAIDDAVLRAMSRDPGDRFPCVRQFGAALMEFASERTRIEFAAELLPPSQTVVRLAALDSNANPKPIERTLTGDTVTPRAAMEDVGHPASQAEPVCNDVPFLSEPSAVFWTELGAGEPVAAHVATFDGVAAVVRGDMMAMLWRSSARAPRTRWVFDIMDRLAARRPGGIVVLMIILPCADPPDREARLENDRRIRRLGSSLRAASTVVLGNGVLQTLLRSAIRAMMLPHLHRLSAPSTIEATIDAGIARLRARAGPATPLPAQILDDVQAMFTALGLDAPGWGEAPRKSA